MALSHDFDTSNIDGKISKRLWDDMANRYYYLGNGSRLIKYPHKEFKLQGIPAPWQTIAWRKIIRIMGEDNFSTLPAVLNYNGDSEVLFEREFIKYFGNSAKPENLEVTFCCGYFWWNNDNKRDKMLNFVVDTLLKKGITVIIWTQDETLKKALDDKRKEKLGDSVMVKLSVNTIQERIDVHYTLLKDKNDEKNSRLYIEFPHTEAHNFRLETFLTFEKLESFGCKPKNFMKVLNSYITCWYRPHLLKRFLSLNDFALNLR